MTTSNSMTAAASAATDPTILGAEFPWAEGRAPDVRLAPIGLIEESPLNHRQRFARIRELADSIRDDGLEHELLGRPHPTTPGRIELACGARRIRALALLNRDAVEAGATVVLPWAKVPIRIRAMTDAEVLLAQAAENLERENPHPMEEALIYERLTLPVDKGGQGWTLELAASKTHRDVQHVTRVLQLLQLSQKWRDAFLADEVQAGHAFLAARIPTHRLQDHCLDRVINPHHGSLLTVSTMRDLVRREYMLPIAKADFDVTDATLVPAAGACNGCPHNTSSQGVLFADVAADTDGALCTNPECWDAKCDAGWDRMKVEAKKKGQKVLSDAEAKKIMPYDYGKHLAPDAPFVDCDETCFNAPGGQRKTWAQVIKAATKATKGEPPPVVLARAPRTGDVVQLVAKADAEKLLRVIQKSEAEKREAKGEIDPRQKWKLEQEKARRDAALQHALGRALLAAIMVATEKLSAAADIDKLLALLCTNLLGSAWYSPLLAVAERRGLVPAAKATSSAAQAKRMEEARAAFATQVGKMKRGALGGLALELALVRGSGGVDEDRIEETAAALGIDVKAVRAEARKEFTAAEKAKAKKKPKDVKPVKAKAKKQKAAKATDADDEDEEETYSEEELRTTGDGEPRAGGPEKCAKPCTECDGEHHFSDVMTELAEEHPKHPAALAGVEAWYVCKHCPAWRERTDADDDDDELAEDEGECQVCECQFDTACDMGAEEHCAWANMDHTLCSACLQLVDAAVELADIDPRSEEQLIDALEEQSDMPCATRARIVDVVAFAKAERRLLLQDGKLRANDPEVEDLAAVDPTAPEATAPTRSEATAPTRSEATAPDERALLVAFVKGAGPQPRTPALKALAAHLATAAGVIERGEHLREGKDEATSAVEFLRESAQLHGDPTREMFSRAAKGIEKGRHRKTEAPAAAPASAATIDVGEWERVIHRDGNGPAHTIRDGSSSTSAVCGVQISSHYEIASADVRDCRNCALMRNSHTSPGQRPVGYGVPQAEIDAVHRATTAFATRDEIVGAAALSADRVDFLLKIMHARGEITTKTEAGVSRYRSYAPKAGAPTDETVPAAAAETLAKEPQTEAQLFSLTEDQVAVLAVLAEGETDLDTMDARLGWPSKRVDKALDKMPLGYTDDDYNITEAGRAALRAAQVDALVLRQVERGDPNALAIALVLNHPGSTETAHSTEILASLERLAPKHPMAAEALRKSRPTAAAPPRAQPTVDVCTDIAALLANGGGHVIGYITAAVDAEDGVVWASLRVLADGKLVELRDEKATGIKPRPKDTPIEEWSDTWCTWSGGEDKLLEARIRGIENEPKSKLWPQYSAEVSKDHKAVPVERMRRELSAALRKKWIRGRVLALFDGKAAEEKGARCRVCDGPPAEGGVLCADDAKLVEHLLGVIDNGTKGREPDEKQLVGKRPAPVNEQRARWALAYLRDSGIAGTNSRGGWTRVVHEGGGPAPVSGPTGMFARGPQPVSHGGLGGIAAAGMVAMTEGVSNAWREALGHTEGERLVHRRAHIGGHHRVLLVGSDTARFGKLVEVNAAGVDLGVCELGDGARARDAGLDVIADSVATLPASKTFDRIVMLRDPVQDAETQAAQVVALVRRLVVPGGRLVAVLSPDAAKHDDVEALRAKHNGTIEPRPTPDLGDGSVLAFYVESGPAKPASLSTKRASKSKASKAVA